MKNHLIRQKINLGKKDEQWLYLKSIELQQGVGAALEMVPLCRIKEGIRTFETYHEAISLKSKHLDDRWEVASCYDVLLETVNQLNEALA